MGFSFFLLMLVRSVTSLFFRFDIRWLSQQGFEVGKEVRLIVLLNHTSLFEPVFIRVAPVGMIWWLSRHILIPGADTTTQRPVVGRFLKFILPGIVPISRKRDESWQQFLGQIKADSVVAIMPEGRMKRADGLDKFGKSMSVKGGVADILQHLNGGKILFVYSGGLHHVQSPGQHLPRIFKTIKVNLEMVDITAYKQAMQAQPGLDFTTQVVLDMQNRLESKIPYCDEQPCNQK
ncbi:MAG: 1-acyl-sn-glycerol-3-phosphate acyltransferase [Oceanospirillaceae bacterium]|nr:1-acyl-sn-glycerol-3-phosphate acyltransferase [Oceanospirillaceae bacterium]MCP5349586.1 1-acyl-sn-glycerol-3-phosphate acyltransferase [Oceanospirillaceae bacterium]